MSGTAATPSPIILVSGDVVIDHHLYEGERITPVDRLRRGVRHFTRLGGAAGLRDLIEDALTPKPKTSAAKQGEVVQGFPPMPEYPVRLGITTPPGERGEPLAEDGAKTGPDTSMYQAFAVWKPYRRDRDNAASPEVWRAHLKMGYGHQPIPPPDAGSWQPSPAMPCKDSLLRLLVLDDAAFGLRNRMFRSCWHLDRVRPERSTPILLKLSAPVAQGDLWRELVSLDTEQQDWSERLVCLVAADDLRRSNVSIARGRSWERSLEDLAEALRSPALRPLLRCAHLVITFDGDGALWLRPRQREQPAVLCFEAGAVEGDYAAEFDGESIGYVTAMAAALAVGLARHGSVEGLDLREPMRRGLAAMRDLLRHGHGRVDKPGSGPAGQPASDTETPTGGAPSQPPSGYPTERLGEVLRETEIGFASLCFNWPPPATAGWTLIEATVRPRRSSDRYSLVGLAAAVARRGSPEYQRLPHVAFGSTVTTERREIEMLRNIRHRMEMYRRRPELGERPLTIGVFGPPGAGKSRAVKEIAHKLFGPKAWLEFNLSQFRDETDLIGALHQVRDRVLAGHVPVAFWDEFDAEELKWLRYLLAPLQDGRFQAGPLTHWVGRSVFVFAGGTADSRRDFGREREGLSELTLRQRKVPDFISRLDAHYDVSGPNPQVGEAAPDAGYALRRALLIRGQLRLEPDAELAIDPDLLRALLLVPTYRHGARSLEKLLHALHPGNGAMMRLSDLPSRAQLEAFVDAKAFMEIIEQNRAFAASGAPERIAPEIHAAYQRFQRANKYPIRTAFEPEYSNLDEAARFDNIAAARRAPAVLGAVGLGLQASDEPVTIDAAITEYISHNVDRLAEAEHNGWWETRRNNGWSKGEVASDERREHPAMVPYDQLSLQAKCRARALVAGMPERLAAAGFRIVRLPVVPGPGGEA